MRNWINKSLAICIVVSMFLSTSLSANSDVLKQDVVSKEVFMKNVSLSQPVIYTILKDYEELSKKEHSVEELKAFSTTLEFGILLGIIYTIPVGYASIKEYLVSKNLDFSYITEENIKKIMSSKEYEIIYKNQINSFCNKSENKNSLACESKEK